MGQDTDAEQPIQVQHAAQEHDGWWSRCLQERVTLASSEQGQKSPTNTSILVEYQTMNLRQH